MGIAKCVVVVVFGIEIITVLQSQVKKPETLSGLQMKYASISACGGLRFNGQFNPVYALRRTGKRVFQANTGIKGQLLRWDHKKSITGHQHAV